MVLDTQPTANVTIALSSSDLTEGMVAPSSLTFTTANWNVAQTVTVTGVDDLFQDGNFAYTIVTAPAHGTTTVNTTTGEVTYTPAQGFSGTDTFTYTVADVAGAVSNPATVSIVVNRRLAERIVAHVTTLKLRYEAVRTSRRL